MKHKEYQQKRASLDDAYLMGDISLSDYARDSINLDFKYNQFMYEMRITDNTKKSLHQVVMACVKFLSFQ